MKKIIILFTGFLFFSLNTYAAPDRTGQWDMGIKIGGALPASTQGSNVTYLGGDFAYGINNWAAVGASTGWTDAKLRTVNGRGVEINGGKYGMLPLFLDIIYRAPTPAHYDYLSPYGVLGIGTVVTHKLSTQDLANYNLGSKVNSGLAFKLGLGLDWFLNTNWIFNMELNYVFSGVTVDIVNTGTNATIDSKDLDYLYIGVGSKYLFS